MNTLSIAGYQFVYHEGRFDIKHLVLSGGMNQEFLLNTWAHDTKLMAYVCTEKIPDEWLSQYNIERDTRNKTLPQGYSHRKAAKHSLKTLAPYFLDVPWFWEDPTNHDSDEYVLKDVEYTYELYHKLHNVMNASEHKFYTSCQMPWAKELLRAELRGVKLNTALLETKRAEATSKVEELSRALRDEFHQSYDTYREGKLSALNNKYQDMYEIALAKKIAPTAEETQKIYMRYEALKVAAIQVGDNSGKFDFNIDSPLQLAWLLKDELGLDIRNYKGDDSTDKEVLEKLGAEYDEVGLILEYRKWAKLHNTYYPSYLKFNREGRIHCSFNTATTRTGRLSSSGPNLQNQPPETRELFIADPGMTFIIRDLAAVEPMMIAHFSQDPVLLKLLTSGGDFHGETAKVIFPYIECNNTSVKEWFPKERAVAKTAGLAILYGSGATRLRIILEKQGFFEYTKAMCQAIVKRIRKHYKGVWEFKETLDTRFSMGETVTNYMGRPLTIEDPADVYMKGFNKLIQSSASDIVLAAAHRFNAVHRAWCKDAQCLILVHDEILAQVPYDDAISCEEALDRFMTSFPLDGGLKLKTEGAISSCWVK